MSSGAPIGAPHRPNCGLMAVRVKAGAVPRLPVVLVIPCSPLVSPAC